ncbi:hypothetical protein AgCh_007593 [Apium graveolens]
MRGQLEGIQGFGLIARSLNQKDSKIVQLISKGRIFTTYHLELVEGFVQVVKWLTGLSGSGHFFLNPYWKDTSSEMCLEGK